MRSAMLAVFDWDTARAPKGLESLKSLQHHHTGLKTDSERRHSEELCREVIDHAVEHHRGHVVKSRQLGSGNGFAFEGGPYCSYAHRDGIHALFSGEVSKWPGLDLVSASHNAFVSSEEKSEQNEAHWLLDFYQGLEVVFDCDAILESLAQIEGRFGFVLYDERRKRVMASRDALGAEDLYWGVTEEGQLLLGTSAVDLDGCEPSAVTFPSGTLYVSQGDTVAENPGERGWVIAGNRWPGRLLSFVKGEENAWRHVKEIPRVTSRGTLCGAVYRVDSERDLEGRGNFGSV
ncbi:hypothetical protein BSKO_00262 [Bryopsis sp. KO-2023]|nr:hypothetical protein BSKO_00262 [Bryopsis sp. KO-2023]